MQGEGFSQVTLMPVSKVFDRV